MREYGFTLVRERTLGEVGGIVRLWRHEATGAELLSILNEDENKTFGVTFRTPVSDATGVPHILEHSVLCGSEKYTVKEPFVTLLKNSLQTFLNAMTFPDKTCYPVASANLKDFRNLVDVYLDAVFFPKLSEDTFRQEGWHFEPDGNDSAGGELTYQGVVFNEMKGVYSSPDELLEEKSQQSLFAGHPYALSYGGDPEFIPSLTYEAFRAFHAKYYHPSNARFFFWGDDPEDGRFAMLEPYLRRFGHGAPAPEIPLVRGLPAPHRTDFPFVAAEENPRAHMTMNWLLPESSDMDVMFVLTVLNHVLLGLPGSPLRRALLESGYGEDIAGVGLDMNLRQAYFSVGLRSIDPVNVPRIEALIKDVLTGLASDGIDGGELEAAVNSVEFSLRENNTGSYPRGLSAMIGILPTWLHGGDPIRALAWEEPLARLKERIGNGRRVMEDAISTYFLDNPASTVVLMPDNGLDVRMADAERNRLSRVVSAMTMEERKDIVAVAAALHAAQREPDAPEDVATVPALMSGDLPRKPTPIPTEQFKLGDVYVLTHALDTTGIAYVSFLMPLDAVPADLIPLVPLYSRALTELGTGRHDFVELGRLIASKTGGMSAGAVCVTREGDLSAGAYLAIGGKATVDKVDEMFALIREVLFDASFDNRSRFALMAAEEAARMEQDLIPAGHAVVAGRLAAGASAAGGFAESTSGITNWDYTKGLLKRIDDDWEGVLADLHHLHGIVVQRSGSVVNVTADTAGIRRVMPCLEILEGSLPCADRPKPDWGTVDLPEREVLLVPSQVNYVGAAGNLLDAGYEWSGAAGVVARHIRMDWLWNNVRVRGGAYGASMRLDRINGTAVFTSYRDPNVDSTLRTYAETGRALTMATLSSAEIDQLIVGTIGDVDAYRLPDAKGRMALIRYLCGETEEKRRQLRDEIFSTSRKDFILFGEALAEAMRHPNICVLGGIDAEKAAVSGHWSIRTLL